MVQLKGKIDLILSIGDYLRQLLGISQKKLRKKNWKVGKYRYSPRYIRAPSYH